MKPIDLSNYNHGSNLLNQIIYGNDNPFQKDDTVNKYINKMNTPGFKQIGQCPVCLDNDVDMIPFDCTHFVCANYCYPKIIMDNNNGCPTCRMSI